MANLYSTMSSGKEHDSREPLPTDTPESAATVKSEDSGEEPVLQTSIGSGLIKQAPKQSGDAHVAVPKVCPQCGDEYETGDRFCPKDGAPLRPKGSSDPMIGRVIADRYLILA
ncbi:MAG TPA: zinc ribbon domain-containing protein, partial [Gemmatimonadaceae bacterium]